MSDYQVKLEKFEGPLNLLLELIEKEDLSVTEVSLARVADQYLDHIRNTRDIRLEHLAEFLSVASRLILIKSRAILPELKFSEEEEEEIRDLTLQLEEFKKFKEASLRLGKIDLLGKRAYSREGYRLASPMFYPPEDINIYDLKKYFQKILSEIPILSKLEEEVVREVVTLEEKISHMTGELRKRVESSFSEIVSGASDKVEVIVSFLAMLEMVKQRLISVDQNDLFQEIKIKMQGN